jgi:hypothetical protein
MRINGPISGAGIVEVRCGNCRKKSHWDKRNLRAGLAEGNRLVHAEAAARRELAANLKAVQRANVAAAEGNVEEANRQINARMHALETVLASSLARTEQFHFESLKTTPRMPVWDPGALDREE